MEEVMRNLLNNGPLHGASNDDTGHEISNKMQKLVYTRTTVDTLWTK